MLMLQNKTKVVRGQIKMGKNYDYTHIFDGVYAPNGVHTTSDDRANVLESCRLVTTSHD